MVDIKYFSANPDSPADGYWDMALLKDILAQPAFKTIEAPDGAIVIIPGKYQAKFIDEINKELAKYPWVVLFITSDEESWFPVQKIDHPNIRIWLQYAKPDMQTHISHKKSKTGIRKLPLGYTSETRKHLKFCEKDLDVFYSGQKTHVRRELFSEGIKKAIDSYKLNARVIDTGGFTQGIPPKEYMDAMCRAKVAPAPSGAVSQDSFRFYEALEAGALPIADNISPSGSKDFWDYLFFGESTPFTQLNNPEDIQGYIKDEVQGYPHRNNEVQAWWIKKKRDLKWQIIQDIEAVSGSKQLWRQQTTAIIPVSPITSHPSIEILEATVKSIRHWHPDSEIIITFDGVREEQESKGSDYATFIRHALFMCNTEWNAVPIIFNKHTHQVGMARVALEEVKTQTILYCEQDTPLVTDEPIQWTTLISDIENGYANVIRFHFEAGIPESHRYLMLDPYPLCSYLLRTIQWSNRPHLASTAFYKWMLKMYFSKDAKCFIEDKIHSVVQTNFAELGTRGWDMWKLFIYYPDSKNIKRSLNLDGRAGGQKYDTTQIF